MHYLGTLKVLVEEVMDTLLLSVCASTEYRQRSIATHMPAPRTRAASSGAPPHNQTFAETIIFLIFADLHYLTLAHRLVHIYIGIL